MRAFIKIPLYGVLCLVLSVLAVPFLGTAAAHAAGPDPEGTIYVADAGSNSIDVFPPGTSGNVAPSRTISGPDTGINEPGDVKVDSAGDIYVSNFGGNTITEYAAGASGDASPICTIGGSNTDLDENDDMSLASDGTLYVGNFDEDGGTYPVVVFAPGACGNVAPERVIAGSATGLSLVDGLGVDATGTLYVDNSFNNSTDTYPNEIDVFAPGASGNVAPEYSIAGAATDLSGPDDIIVGFNGELYVTNGFGTGINSVTVFAPGSEGDVAPVQYISGSNTDFGNPDDLAVDSSGNIYVTDASATIGPALLEWSAGATGNVAPSATIAGGSTSFFEPEGVAIAGPGVASDSLTSSVSAPSINLGESTQDTAILSGGNSPTGSIEFKLFGPNDSTCSETPAYISPFTSVDGNGSYLSPAFTPTAVGTYFWVDLYSGDPNNAAASTVCGDPEETVTVTNSCDTGPWPSQVSGVPTVTPNEARGFYIGVNNDTGQWTIEDTHLQVEPRQFFDFDATITTDGTFTDVSPIMLEGHDSVTVSSDQHTLTYVSRDGGSIDGVSFTPMCGSTITFNLSIKGVTAPTKNIHLGVPATSPSTNPFTFTRSS